MYGDLDVTREGDGADGPFRIVFRPVGPYITPAGANHMVDNLEGLKAFLHDVGLSNDQVRTMCSGLENAQGSWLRVLAATAFLKRNGLI